MRARGILELSGREVHIWTLPTTAASATAVMFEPILAPDELDRARRFHFTHLRESFLIARGALRCLLGRYLDLHPKVFGSATVRKGNPLSRLALISSST